ncbi:hypothetical protein KEM54_000127 [Ascosphaera aggregata]|nr:hypothetical protein KEM54_000127 [Ascosphaera aggregata]
MAQSEPFAQIQSGYDEKHSDGEAGLDVQMGKGNDCMAELPHVEAEVEKRLLRKLDYRLPVVTGLLYLVAFLDRSNIGNAKIVGMQEALSLDSKSYNWLLNIFYISYVIFEFLAFMWKVVPPHYWASGTVFLWGTASTCQAAVRNKQGMMALRFIMGAAEAGFGPGVPYLLSFFYNRREIGFRCGLFLSAAPLANSFAGALAYGLTSGHSGLANWRLLFLVEGLLTVLVAPVAFFFLPDSASTAKFLTEEEKAAAGARSLRRNGEETTDHSINCKDTLRTLMDLKPWLTALMYFSCNVSFSSLPVFLPTVLKDMGFTSIKAQGLTAPPFFASFLVTIFSTWVADRTQQRAIVIMALSTVGAIGYVITGVCTEVGPRYFGVFLCACGVFPSIGNILPWVLNNQGSDSGRGMAIVILNIIGQCGPFLGTNMFPDSESPRYLKGMWVCAAFMFFTVFVAFCLRTLLAWENKKLDKQYGTVLRPQGGNNATGNGGGAQHLAEEKYGELYRYVL